MSIRDVVKAVRPNHIATGAVLAFGLAGQALAGTSLSCAGVPKTVTVIAGNVGVTTFFQVCKIATLKAPLTAGLNVTTKVGDVTAHGGRTETAIPVYARIIARDDTLAKATILANRVVISTANGTVSAQDIPVNFPQQLKIDYELFTPSITEASLTSAVGNVSADNYSTALTVNAGVGNIVLQTIDGDVQAKAGTGSITIHLNGTAWTGTGLKATTGVGNILLSRPAGYQAAISATAGIGVAEVDGQVKSFPFPATLATGTGQPIKLSSNVGEVTVDRTN